MRLRANDASVRFFASSKAMFFSFDFYIPSLAQAIEDKKKDKKG